MSERPGARAGTRRAIFAVFVLTQALALLAALGPARAARAGEAAAPDPRGDARRLLPLVDATLAAVATSDRAAAAERMREIQDRWGAVEDPIRALDATAYRTIERHMADASFALKPGEEWRPDEARAALVSLREACRAFAESKGAASVPPASSEGEARASLRAFQEEARRALEVARTADAGRASERLRVLDDLWPGVEAFVKLRDPAAYSTCEESLAQARAALGKGETARAVPAFERLGAALLPVVAAEARYGPLDAAAILLREGAEAILVLAALASFLKRTGAKEKVRLVWTGGAIGLLASVGCGLALALAFRGVAAATARREVLEGVSSLVAAALLVVVGLWLHAKISRGGWKTQVQAAVRGGRSLSLALVAFFAVFREGAETVLFYAALAPATDGRSLLLGVALGSAALAALAFVVLGLGRRLPLGPFFRVATALLWLLAVKFVGEGLAALQAGGVVPATAIQALPSLPLLGFHPTVETCAGQGAALLVWAGFAAVPRLRRSAALDRTAGLP